MEIKNNDMAEAEREGEEVQKGEEREGRFGELERRKSRPTSIGCKLCVSV